MTKKHRHSPVITSRDIGLGTSQPSTTLDWNTGDLTVSGDVSNINKDWLIASDAGLSKNITYFNAAEIANV